MSSPTIETASGLFFDYSAPTPEMVDVRDIARALSMTCRFGGHVTRFYSVAEHALIVRDIVKAWGRPDLGYYALHHDSEEAYLGDIPRPLKRLLGEEFAEMRFEAEAAIHTALGLPVLRGEDVDLIHKADNAALLLEARTLKFSRGEHTEWGTWGLWEPPADVFIACLPAWEAEHDFLYAHALERAVIDGTAGGSPKEAS